MADRSTGDLPVGVRPSGRLATVRSALSHLRPSAPAILSSVTIAAGREIDLGKRIYVRTRPTPGAFPGQPPARRLRFGPATQPLTRRASDPSPPNFRDDP